MPMSGETAPYVADEIATWGTNIASVISSINTTLLAYLPSIDTGISNINTGLGTLHSDFNTVNTHLSDINTTAGQIKADLDSILTVLNTLNTTLGAVNTDINNAFNISGLGVLGVLQLIKNDTSTLLSKMDALTGRIRAGGGTLAADLVSELDALKIDLDSKLDILSTDLVPIGNNTGLINTSVGTALVGATAGLGGSIGAVIGGPGGALIGVVVPALTAIVGSISSIMTASAMTTIAGNTTLMEHHLSSDGLTSVMAAIEGYLQFLANQISSAGNPEIQDRLAGIQAATNALTVQLENFFNQDAGPDTNNIWGQLQKIRRAMGASDSQPEPTDGTVAQSQAEIAKQDIEMSSNRGESSVILHARTILP